jgi:(1->4)-alpha-D-glucan 1-alpha-D-glucosylmutase
VPEVYWGGERWVPALVDPDNRRVPSVLGDDGADAPELRLTAAALRLRRERPEWFLAGASYEPLRARGEAAGHCLAFARSGAVVAVATRLSLRLALAGGWRDTSLRLPPGVWRDAVSGGAAFEGEVALASLLATAPVALLRRA